MITLCIRNLIGCGRTFLQVMFLFGTVCNGAHAQEEQRFRFHVVDEPSQIRPNFSDRFTGQYLIGNLFHGFYRYDGQNRLVPALAKSCIWKSEVKLVCNFPRRQWSGGKSFTAHEIHGHLRRSLDPKAVSASSAAFLGVVGYKDFLAGKKPWSTVGIKLRRANDIEFTLEKPDRDFLFRLTHPGLSPIPEGVADLEAGRDYATGPYKLDSWKRGRSLLLNSNPPEAKRPPVEVFFIAEDLTALHLFEKNQLDLLRKMPTESDRKYANDPRFRMVPFVRFDYLGIGPHVEADLLEKIRLQEAFDYLEFQRVFNMKGAPPGCIGIPDSWQARRHCVKFKPQLRMAEAPRLEVFYAAQAGDDIARTMQWLQGQYKKHRGGFLELKSEDVKMLTARLRKAAPDMFRRGLPLDRPSCQAGLEAFTTGSKDNFIGFSDPKYDALVERMRSPKLKEAKLKAMCSEGIQMLLGSKRIIPWGQIHYPMMDAGTYKGWAINNLNQLDLTGLQPKNNTSR